MVREGYFWNKSKVMRHFLKENVAKHIVLLLLLN